jgi:hypothetical protein
MLGLRGLVTFRLRQAFSVSRFARIALLGLGLLLALGGRASAEVIVNNHPIEGYVDHVNVVRGGTATFYVHAPHGSYNVTFVRYGHNDSSGNSSPQIIAGPYHHTGAAQNYNALAFQEGAHWSASFQQVIPSTWTSGYYAAELEDTTTHDTFYVSFIVEDPAGAQQPIALVASTNTWQAYNFWPADAFGGSFYDASECGTPFANTISFLRPNPYATPLDIDAYNCEYPPYERTDHLTAGEIRIARWLERNGYHYSMLTDADIDQNPALLRPSTFKTVIISTHSEYWTQNMYNAVSEYEKAGGNVVDLSGNAMYRKVTISPEQTISKVPPVDPYGNGAVWSTSTQAALLGMQASFDEARCQPYSVNKSSHWLYAGIPVTTGSLIGTSTEFSSLIGCGSDVPAAAGWEVDQASPVFARQYVSLASATLQGPSYTGHSDIIYMRRASAGQVFAAGSILFGQSLMADSKLPTASQRLTPLIKNVLTKFQTQSFSDFSGDGTTDLIGRNQSGALVRYDSDGHGHLIEGGVQFNSGWSGMRFIVNAGDFTGNGHSDLVGLDGSGNLKLYKGDGSGGLVQDGGTTIATGWSGYSYLMSPGDFDGDGNPDLLATDSSGLWLFKGNGHGALQSGRTQVGSSGWNSCRAIVGPGDFNGDGNPDVMCLDTGGTLWLYKGDGKGGWLSSNGTNVASGLSWVTTLLDAGDFTGTGKPSLIARDGSGNIWLYTGDGQGHLGERTLLDSGGWETYNLLLSVW